jgi:NadR type nicotinamide-nucleotide adenylyltransferase
VISGPESSGKTTLASQLSDTLEVPWVPEFARMYLENLDRDYVQSDLLEMAKGQLALEKAELDKKPPLLLCDTDLLTFKIWSEVKYGQVDPFIQTEWLASDCHGYLLCKPDIPWEADPMRESPYDRDSLFDLHVKALTNSGKRFEVISGEGQRNRLIAAMEIIAKWLNAAPITS